MELFKIDKHHKNFSQFLRKKKLYMKDIKFIVSRYFVKYFNVKFIFISILWIGITNDELKKKNKHYHCPTVPPASQKILRTSDIIDVQLI